MYGGVESLRDTTTNTTAGVMSRRPAAIRFSDRELAERHPHTLSIMFCLPSPPPPSIVEALETLQLRFGGDNLCAATNMKDDHPARS